MSYPDTDAIRAREQAATPGPWEIVLIDDGRFYGEPPTFDIASTANGRHESVASGGVLEDGGPVLGAALGIDAEFIAHARSDVPALLDALAAAERHAAEMQVAHDRWKSEALRHYANYESQFHANAALRAKETGN